MDTLTLLGLLGLLEFLFILLAVAVTLFIKLRGARREMAGLRQQLQEAAVVAVRVVAPTATRSEASVPEQNYADFLREQLDRSNILLGEDVQPESAQASDTDDGADAAARDRQMLAARHQFLQLELDQQAHHDEDNPAQLRQRLVDGMQALLNAMGWQSQSPSAAADELSDVVADDVRASRSEIVKLEEQIASLRRVIDNQHDSMRDLRQLLEAQGEGGGGESDELKAALKKLRNAEAEAVELYRCMEVVESENDRLKHARKTAGAEGGAVDNDTETLRDLVDDQKRTINTLKDLLRGIASSSDKKDELDAAFDKIQRTNNELNTCIMLLEEENDRLRTTAENLQARFDQQHLALAELAATDAVAAPEVEASIDAAVDADIDIDALLDTAAKPEINVSVAEEIDEIEAGAEAAAVATVDADADFDIDDLLESSAQPATPVVEKPIATAAKTESAAVEVVEDEADFDIDDLLESATRPLAPVVDDEPVEVGAEVRPLSALGVEGNTDAAAKPESESQRKTAPEADQTADDIDALLESFAEGATPAASQRSDKQAVAEDDTDALLNELFGSKPNSPR